MNYNIACRGRFYLEHAETNNEDDIMHYYVTHCRLAEMSRTARRSANEVSQEKRTARRSANEVSHNCTQCLRGVAGQAYRCTRTQGYAGQAYRGLITSHYTSRHSIKKG